MLSWQDTGIILDKAKFGESDLILDVFTREHGRAKGLVRHGQTAKNSGTYGQGNLVAVTWKARLEEHLGNFTAELVKSYSAPVLDNATLLDCLSAALAETKGAFAERDANPSVFTKLQDLLSKLTDKDGLSYFIIWEIDLLKALGFALNLTECAVTGTKDDLAFVSPKTGRAVSKSAAGKWESLLLPLPSFLTACRPAESAEEIVKAMTLTGYFLQKHIFPSSLPAARIRLKERLERSIIS